MTDHLSVILWESHENGSHSRLSALAVSRSHIRRSCCRGFLAGAATLVGICLLIGLPISVQAQDADAPVRRTVSVMGTLATVDIWAPTTEQARRAGNAAIEELERVEGLLSSWRGDTEVGRLNSTAVGVAGQISVELGRLLEEALAWGVRSGGAFHPVVGALVDAWDLRGEGRLASPEDVQRALEAAGSAGVQIDVSAGTVTRLRPGAWIDPGGFGKGAALRSAGDTLRARNIRRARLDLGGQLLLVGEDTVVVGVAHPTRRREVVATLRISDASVATSGQSERTVVVDGQRLGHIIDPRSGQPARAWGSVTVVSSDALVADVLATALFVLGPAIGMELAEALEGVAVLFLEDTGDAVRASHNQEMKPFIRELPGGAGS